MGILRLTLALGVLLWHVRIHRPQTILFLDGGLCVLVFFIISGFYMSMILHEKYVKLPHGHRRFFLNRFLRIFPAYIAVLALQQIDYTLTGMPTVFTSAMDMPLASRLLLILMNVVKFGQDYWQTLVEAPGLVVAGIRIGDVGRAVFGSSALSNHPGHLLIGQGWSLGSELTFYLIAPLIVFRRWRWVAGAIALALATRVLIYWEYGPSLMGSVRTKFFPAIVVFFLMGHLSYLILRRLRESPHAPTIAKIGSLVVAAIFVTPIAVNGELLVGREYDDLVTWGFYLSMMAGLPCLFLATEHSRLDQFVGQYSYPVYLVHGLVIERVAPFHLGGLFQSAVVAGSLLISTILIYAVERPVQAVRARVARGPEKAVDIAAIGDASTASPAF